MSSKTFPTLQTESRLFQSPARFVIGVDEVGRGAIAGPVAVGITIIDRDSESLNLWPEKLQDSKLMSEKNREAIFQDLQKWVYGHAVGFATNLEIDEHGINHALGLAFSRGFAELTQESTLRGEIAKHKAAILLDGSQNWLGNRSAGIDVVLQVGADTNCVSVASASVLAKVTRDALMRQLSGNYPEFGLAENKGYASKSHISALHSNGPSVIHRLTWLGRILGEKQE